jgi:hypothetical protein
MLNITSDKPIVDFISNKDQFYIWPRLKLARSKATESTHWDQKAFLLLLTRISPYFLWTVMTKNISDENVQVIDYHQHIAAKLKSQKKKSSFNTSLLRHVHLTFRMSFCCKHVIWRNASSVKKTSE